jgi:predicted nucleotidyltransferase
MHRREGTRAYFKAQTQSPVFRDLQQLFEKTVGLAPILEQILKSFENKIQSAFIYGSVARSREHAMSDVDVMVIGTAGLAVLLTYLHRSARRRRGWEERSTSLPIPQRSFGRKSNRATISLPPFYEDGNSL